MQFDSRDMGKCPFENCKTDAVQKSLHQNFCNAAFFKLPEDSFKQRRFYNFQINIK